MIRLPLYQVDAFAARLFEGNPAAVVPLGEWLPEACMQSIAAENNLSETAFFAPAAGDNTDFRIRWFTPAAEVPLCGHATLATAAVLDQRRGHTRWPVRFDSLSGPLQVDLAAGRYVLDFPADPPRSIACPDGLEKALGVAAVDCLSGSQGIVVLLDEERRVRELRPDFGLVSRIAERVIVTAAGEDHDFVSRFFAPRLGIDEDPVTGAGHCTLAPFWAGRLGRQRLRARQLSARGGDVDCEVVQDRVLLHGAAVIYLDGEISVHS